MIEDAQAVTKSNSAAARWLGVHYLTYRKYAKIYGLWERHLNMKELVLRKDMVSIENHLTNFE